MIAPTTAFAEQSQTNDAGVSDNAKSIIQKTTQTYGCFKCI
ncbi:hypothetical protein [Brasilonema sennae]|nr:hypothetical protein [Brasilonema sennae]